MRRAATRRRRNFLSTSVVIAVVVVALPSTAAAAAPSNDDFANRTTITSLPFSGTQDTTEATEEAGEPQPDCAYGVGKTVWYEYTPSMSGLVQVDTVGSDFDTVLGIWTGDGLTSLTDVACDDDGAVEAGSMAIFSVVANTPYLIQIGGYDGDSGALSLHVGPPTSGSISGTVTSDTGEPLSDICVEARSESDHWGGWAMTTSSGAYTIGGLSDGTHHVRFYDSCDGQRNHEAEWFDDQATEATATGVPITSPEAVTGIDAELTSLVLGTISGTVTSDSSDPLPSICVYVYDRELDDTAGLTQTGGDGTYSVAVASGTYEVFFYDGCDERRDHQAEWFDDQPTFATATDVPVTAAGAVGIDAELTALGSISGTVTSDTGEPVSPVCVDVYDAETRYWMGWTETTDSGSYVVGVPEGSYHVTFYDCEGVTNYEGEWFDDQPTRETATEVTVNGAGETAGIDAELTTRVLGSISGTVTSNTGQPLGDTCIDVFDSASGNFAGWAYSTSSGTYTASVRPGTYHVEFYDCGWPFNHRGEWFDDQPTRQTATDVVVAAEETTAGIDAELARITAQTWITSGPHGATTSTTASFGFGSSMSGSTFECSLDGSAFAACTSPTSYSGLVEGSHTFRVRAIGPDGEADASPAERSWIVDTSAPVLSIERPTAGTYVNNQSVGGTGPIVIVGSVTVEATAIDLQSGVPGFRFEVDGIPVAPFEVTRQGDRFQFTFRPASAGNHTITARATNAAGLETTTTISVVGVPAG